jgi:hypothetical protein
MREYGGASSSPTSRMSSSGACAAQGFGGDHAGRAVAENEVFHANSSERREGGKAALLATHATQR